MKTPLPIDSLLPQVQQALSGGSSLILQATPGAGKTTRVPPALLAVTSKKILVLEPRRLAASLSAQRVAFEMGEECGATIGYQIRFEKKESQHTRIKFITEGLFLRYLLQDPELSEVGCVVLDEFHERHIHSDIALMLTVLLQRTTRSDLKLVVMSATLETRQLKEYLPDADVITCQTQNHPVQIEYLTEERKGLDTQIYFATHQMLKRHDLKGHILIFLPGVAEIRKCASLLVSLKNEFEFELHELSSTTPVAQQQKVFAPSVLRKVILSTNIAETSLTIDGVTIVIDSGLAKIAGHASWSGLPTLDVKPVSQASCIQRAGRAGRTAPGTVARLFSKIDFHARSEFEVSEIQRLDLAQFVLEIKTILDCLPLSQKDFFLLPWFEPPKKALVDSSVGLLQALGALDDAQALTTLGQKLTTLPLHPRLARILITAQELGVVGQAILVVALIQEGMIFYRQVEHADVSHSDIDYQLNILRALLLKKEVSFAKNQMTDKVQVKKVEQLAQHMCRLLKIDFKECLKPLAGDALSLILLSGFMDRLCKRSFDKNKKKNSHELNLCLGGSAQLMNSSVVQDDEYVIAIEAQEAALAPAQSAKIRVCHGIERDLLLFAPAQFFKETREFFWDDERKMVRGVLRSYYGKLVLQEKQIFEMSSEHEELLVRQLRAAWPKPFDDDLPLQYLKERLSIASKIGYKIDLPNFNEDDFTLFLHHICEQKKSFDEILKKDLDAYLNEYLDYNARRQLNDLLPTHIELETALKDRATGASVRGKNRSVRIHYEEGQPPYIAARIQDFFTLKKNPRICHNKVTVVVHLLAPNGRAVQITSDLENFWQKAYQEVRKELAKKYPRHLWPEKV